MQKTTTGWVLRLERVFDRDGLEIKELLTIDIVNDEEARRVYPQEAARLSAGEMMLMIYTDIYRKVDGEWIFRSRSAQTSAMSVKDAEELVRRLAIG